jgi:hypothetical protein
METEKVEQTTCPRPGWKNYEKHSYKYCATHFDATIDALRISTLRMPNEKTGWLQPPCERGHREDTLLQLLRIFLILTEQAG